MNIEELLQPRIIVENNYPRSPFKHHEIICEPSSQQTEWAKEFTRNFRFLEWWEYRELPSLPEYVKVKGKPIAYKVDEWHKGVFDFVYFYTDNRQRYVEIEKYHLPATEQEFNEYKKQGTTTVCDP